MTGKPNLSSWLASVPAGSPIGTLVGRTQNCGGPAASFSVSAKGGRSFTAAEVDGWVELRTAGPMVEGGASPVVVTARNAAGTSQRTCAVTVTPRVEPPPPVVVVEPPPPPPPPPPPAPETGRGIVRPSVPSRAARLRLTGSGGTRIAMGAQVMPLGFWPPGQVGCFRTLAATRAGLAPGSLLRTQIDCHQTHPDGSAAMLLLAVEAALEAGEVLDVVLEPGARHTAPGEPLAWSTLAAQHVIRAEVPGSVLDGQGVEAGYWRNGPLVAERRAHNPAAGGSRRMVLDVRYTADGATTADAQFANDVALDGGGPWDGECKLTLDGNVWTSGVRHHPIYSRLRATLSTREAPHALHPDVSLMADAGVIPRLDTATGVPAGMVQALLANAAGKRGAPYATAGITQYMPMTGGRGDIGQITAWDAAWLLSGSAELHSLADDVVSAGLGIPMHVWDRTTGTPIMCVGARAQRWMDGRDAAFLPVPEPASSNGGWDVDVAHKPSLGWVAFLCRGERAALDLVLSEAAFAVVRAWPGTRAASPDGLNLIQWQQLRAAAWALRDVVRGAWACPTIGPAAAPGLRGYLGSVVASNLAWLAGKRAEWAATYGEVAGFFGGFDYGAQGGNPPWQQDHMAGAIIQAWCLGWDAAADWLTYAADGWLGQRCLAHPGWLAADGVAYLVAYLDAAGKPLTTWPAVGAEQQRRGWSNGTTWAISSDGNYGILGRATFAALMDIFPGRAELADQWRFLATAPHVATVAATDPQSSVLPRLAPAS